MKRITIRAGSVTVQAELLETPTALAIWSALPITGEASTWGEEIYFEIPVKLPQETQAREEVAVGDLGYWPVGHCFCIFFGATPASTGAQPRAASAVNVFGRVTGDTAALKRVRDGAVITIEAVE